MLAIGSFFGNIVKKVWPIFSKIVTVISLASIGDPLIKWADFIFDLIEIYRNYTYPIWEFILSWIPFLDLPSYCKDYLTLGAIFQYSFTKAISKGGNYNDNLFLNFLVNVIMFFYAIPIWPFALIGLFSKSRAGQEQLKKRIKLYLVQTIVLLILLLIVNYTFFISLKFPTLF